MVNLLQKESRDWKSWALSVAILIIASLAGLLSGTAVSMIQDMRKEFLTEFYAIRIINNEQDKCITELKAHQKTRLDRERGVK